MLVTRIELAAACTASGKGGGGGGPRGGGGFVTSSSPTAGAANGKERFDMGRGRAMGWPLTTITGVGMAGGGTVTGTITGAGTTAGGRSELLLLLLLLSIDCFIIAFDAPLTDNAARIGGSGGAGTTTAATTGLGLGVGAEVVKVAVQDDNEVVEEETGVGLAFAAGRLMLTSRSSWTTVSFLWSSWTSFCLDCLADDWPPSSAAVGVGLLLWLGLNTTTASGGSDGGGGGG